VAVGVEIQAQRVQQSVQLFRTAAVPYRVNHLVDIRSWACDASFGAFGAFGSLLIPFGSHSFLFGRHPFLFDFLFGFPLSLIIEQHFQDQPVLSRHV
jgi:hypothetical protein